MVLYHICMWFVWPLWTCIILCIFVLAMCLLFHNWVDGWKSRKHIDVWHVSDISLHKFLREFQLLCDGIGIGRYTKQFLYFIICALLCVWVMWSHTHTCCSSGRFSKCVSAQKKKKKIFSQQIFSFVFLFDGFPFFFCFCLLCWLPGERTISWDGFWRRFVCAQIIPHVKSCIELYGCVWSELICFTMHAVPIWCGLLSVSWNCVLSFHTR